MEDVLAVYTRPRDPDCPLVCLDESSKQLLAETRVPIPMKPGRPARCDYEYERNGTANLFMMFAPLEGWRRVKAAPSSFAPSQGRWTRSRRATRQFRGATTANGSRSTRCPPLQPCGWCRDSGPSPRLIPTSRSPSRRIRVSSISLPIPSILSFATGSAGGMVSRATGSWHRNWSSSPARNCWRKVFPSRLPSVSTHPRHRTPGLAFVVRNASNQSRRGRCRTGLRRRSSAGARRRRGPGSGARLDGVRQSRDRGRPVGRAPGHELANEICLLSRGRPKDLSTRGCETVQGLDPFRGKNAKMKDRDYWSLPATTAVRFGICARERVQVESAKPDRG